MKLIRSALLFTAITLAGAGAALAQAAPARPVASRTPHPTAGKADCLSCHGPAANEHIKSVPVGHTYANAACLTCHRLAATMPADARHAMDPPHARCAMCHVAGSPTGAKAVPAATHGGYHATTCTMCHQQAPRS